jgi:multimeric flavodoxin WrbA
MKALAINGSPRKKWNTATLLEHALAGAKSQGAQTELVHLYDLAFTGCISCFECKKIGGKSYGRCAVKDGLTEVLNQAFEADLLILGSPFYFGTETGEMRSCMERLLFPFFPYTPDYASLFPRRIQTAFVYTMNVNENEMAQYSQDKAAAHSQWLLNHVYGHCELLLVTDTYQFDDYAKYLSTRWDPAHKAERRREVFPQDCAKAFAMGAELARTAKA